MNKKTWKKCCILYIGILEGNVNHSIKPRRTIMKWNREFRVESHELRFFNSPPKSRNEMIKFYSDYVKIGTLSPEALRNDINIRIFSDSYQYWLLEHKDETYVIQSHEELMFDLNLNNIYIMTIWRWGITLGYKYGENKSVITQMVMKDLMW